MLTIIPIDHFTYIKLGDQILSNFAPFWSALHLHIALLYILYYELNDKIN